MDNKNTENGEFEDLFSNNPDSLKKQSAGLEAMPGHAREFGDGIKTERVKYSRKTRGIVITAISMLTIVSILLISGSSYALATILSIDYGNGSEFVANVPLELDEEGGTDILDDVKIWDGATRVTDIPLQGDNEYIRNILFLGVDAREKNSFAGRTDTIIIVTINDRAKTIKMTSILRDTLVAVPGRDHNKDGRDDLSKINNTYAFGGFDLLSKTIEQNFRLKIVDSIAVNFHVFESCVDILGGVDIELTAAEAQWMNIGQRANTYALNGFYALEYVRIRMLDSDYHRSGRQRTMLTSLLKKAENMDVVTLMSLMNKICPNVRTSLTTNQLSDLVLKLPTYMNYEIISNDYFPAQGDFLEKKDPVVGWVEEIQNPAEAVTKLHHWIYD